MRGEENNLRIVMLVSFPCHRHTEDAEFAKIYIPQRQFIAKLLGSLAESFVPNLTEIGWREAAKNTWTAFERTKTGNANSLHRP